MKSPSKLDQAMLTQLKELLGERFEELVQRFIGDGSKRMERLRVAVAQKNFDVIRTEAHGLKGSSFNMGANLLGGVCADLEDAGQDRTEAGLATKFAALEKEFAAACTALQAYLNP